mmetsp:Transcript_20897/g.41666  ORF Transcript_20897/g.41666 Transcript_20897/m.41666 type:complete len:93 (-) Transcript_20897:281-559(-)
MGGGSSVHSLHRWCLKEDFCRLLEPPHTIQVSDATTKKKEETTNVVGSSERILRAGNPWGLSGDRRAQGSLLAAVNTETQRRECTERQNASF